MEPIEMAAEFGVWTQVVDSAAFSPRDTAEDLVYDGRMWLSNGYYHGDVLTRDLWSSSDGVTWDLVNDATPYDGYSEMAVYDNKMWAVKGSGADIWHSVDGVEWTLVMESAPYGNRTAAAVVVFGGKLWVMGGYIESTNQPPEQGYPQFTTFNDVWCSADGLNWTRVLEQAPWAKRMWFIARAYGDRIWIVGGYDNVHAKNFGDVCIPKMA